MPKVLIVYYSRGGNTEAMAKLLAEGAKAVGVSVELKTASAASPEDLLEADGIIIGSPTYYGQAATPIRKLFDNSVKFHGQLRGKVAAAFSSSANIGGGNETTILSILHSMLIHGMIVQGNPQGDHYGPVSIGAPDDRVKKQCRDWGRRTAELVQRLAP